MIVMNMEIPFGIPNLQINRQTGNKSDDMSNPKNIGTRKFFAIIIINVKAMIKSKK